MFYTSRSAVESYQDCPRYRYNQNYLLKKGVVPIQKSVPLVTGGAVHRGVEHLLNRVRIGQQPNVDIAVQEAVRQYRNDVEAVGFSDKNIKNDKQQEFTYYEQMALTEGLVRAWVIVELPRIQERYKVLAVERDIEPIEIASGVWFQAKVDGEFQELSSNDYHNYSLKTMKQWDERSENSYKSDLQGITEIWAVEQDSLRGDRIIDEVVKKMLELDQLAMGRVTLKVVEQTTGFFLKKKLGKKVSAVRFCILIKGARYKSPYNEDPELMITHSPLVRGYKLVTPTSIEYAHSFRYPNPNNKSGFGILGKGWEPFNVWEQMGVGKWIEMIGSGEIQPEVGDILQKQVITPTEYFRSEGEIEEAIAEIKAQEYKIKYAIDLSRDTNNNVNQMDSVFPHIRKHCEFHFGQACEYKTLCWQPEVKQDPLGSGLYQVRMPHHAAERDRS
jgi:hypothetical protein